MVFNNLDSFDELKGQLFLSKVKSIRSISPLSVNAAHLVLSILEFNVDSLQITFRTEVETEKFFGVHTNRSGGGFRWDLTIKGKKTWECGFRTTKDAALAYDKMVHFYYPRY